MSARLLDRIKHEYDEMPGLSLTPRQARRLLGADPDACDEALCGLAREGFLRQTASGMFVRAEHRRPADLHPHLPRYFPRKTA